MFPVGRYDPNANNNTKKQQHPRKKRQRSTNEESRNERNQKESNDNQHESSSLHVIAENVELQQLQRNKQKQLEDGEDLDLEDLIVDLHDESVEPTDGKKKKHTHTTATADTTTMTTIGQHAEQGDESEPNEPPEKSNIPIHFSMLVPLEDIHKSLQLAKTVPLLQVAKEIWNLAPFLIENLGTFPAYKHFFPVQAFCIPDIISTQQHDAYHQVRDVCITAPTGSGKTLAYVLPIVHALSLQHCNFRRTTTTSSSVLRCLVILPNRDLAMQIYRVFQTFVKGSNLMVGLAIGGGQTDFITEQQSLTIRNTTAKNTYSTLNSGIPSVGDTKTTTTPTPIIITEEDRAIAMHRLAHYEPENLSLALDVFNCAYVPSLSPSTSTGTSHPTPNIPASGWSAVDILVGTPGRILDHLDRTPGFTLQHLQFLVVDEADKLLMGQSRYHNWMERILSAATTTTTTTTANNDDDAKKSWDSNLGYTWNGMSILLEPRTFRSKWNRDDVVCPVQLRKFLVSATMTRDPQKLAALQLVHPIHYDMHRLPTNFLQNDKEENENSTQPLPIPKYAMPHGLEEFTVECTAEQKPLALLALLLEKLEECKKDGPRKKGSVIVIFTASLDSTHRLARLLQLVWMTLSDDNDDVEISSDFIAEFSSALRQHERSAIMARCNTDNNDDDKEDDSKKKKSLGVLVCTDGMSRGMDIGATVDLVINYDVPKHAKTYLHRCGRAARAGRTGTATTLLKGAGQAGAFVRMRNAIQNPESMQSKVIPTSFVRENVVAAYRHSVKALKEVLEAEANGDLGYTESLNSSFLPPQT